MSTLEIPDHVAISFFVTYVNGEPSGSAYNSRCPVCGDSENNIHKKRMYLIKKDSNWLVYCHNCAYCKSLLRFIKDFYPSQYSHVSSQCVRDFLLYDENKKVKEKRLKQEKINKALKNIMLKVNSKTKKSNVEKYIEKNSIPLTDEQKQIFYNRKLDDTFISKLSFCIDGDFKNRILIPFLTENNKPYYFQAMKTKENQKKYINWEDKTLEVQYEKPLYNECFIDNTKRVYITEGLIDSVFLENAVATCGATLSIEKIKTLINTFNDRVWVVDNDKAGKDLAIKLFKLKETCFLMPKKFKYLKDVNDLVIEIGKEETRKIIENNVYNSLNGLLELQRR